MKPVSFQDILWQNPKTGKWYHQNRELQKEELDNLRTEAAYLSGTIFWKILINEGKFRAQTKAFTDADTGDDKKDLTELRKAQEYHRMILMIEELIRKLNISTRETSRDRV